MKKPKPTAAQNAADMKTEAADEGTLAGGDTPPTEVTSEQAHDAPHRYPESNAGAELTRVKQERDKHYEQLQRTLADLQNFRKRRGQEISEIRQLAVEALAAELLPVLDNFHLATDASKTDASKTDADRVDGEVDGAKAVREGLLMVKAMLEGVLERHGLREVPAEGQAFDHTLHEAVGLAETSDTGPGQVAKVIQKGYFLGDRILRHAKVLVAGEVPAKPEADTTAKEGQEGDK